MVAGVAEPTGVDVASSADAGLATAVRILAAAAAVAVASLVAAAVVVVSVAVLVVGPSGCLGSSLLTGSGVGSV